MLYFLLWTFSVLPFLPGLMESEWASERAKERERGKRRKTTQKQNEEEKSIFIEKLWDFSCAFHPPTRIYFHECLQQGGKTHTHTQSHFKFSECHCTGSCDCCTDFISSSPVSDHHHRSLNDFILLWKREKGATGYWRWRQSSKLHNRSILIHC